MTLTIGSQNSLDLASNVGVNDAMSRVAANFSDAHWFTETHVYRSGPGANRYDQLRIDLDNGNVDVGGLAEYVSVSVPTHTLDGWSLLGRSVNCLLKGDPYSSLHLAYYAELRATIAILASEGIGIFDRKHCIVENNGQCTLIDVIGNPYGNQGNPRKELFRTHECTWAVFQWWANEKRSIDFLRQVIKPDGRNLGNWIDASPRSRYAFQAIGAEWLKIWGIDIERFFGDRDARNDASYWPNTIENWETRTVFEHCVTISDIWDILEPEPGARFARLDRHLLRNVLRDGYESATVDETTPAFSSSGFNTEIDELLRNLGLTDARRDYWHQLLTDTNREDPLLIRLARNQSDLGEKMHVLGVISRATMLLRLATGASANLLFESGIKRESIDFWIESIGIERGLWAESDSPDDLSELWPDVEDEVERWSGLRRQPSLDPYTIYEQHSRSLAILTKYEKVALWGLGL